MVSRNIIHKGGVVYRPVDTNNPKYSLPTDEFYKSFKKGLASEKDLCNFNKEYIKLINKYKEKIEAHLENLDKIDESLGDNINIDDFHSFRKSFEILTNNNTLEDNLQPLLLKNYEYISENDNDVNIIEYHLDQQISYLIFNYYNESEQRIFNSIIFRNLLKEPEFKVITTDGKITDFLPLPHVNYQLDYVKVKKILDQIVDYSIKSKTKVYDDEPALLTTLPSSSISNNKTHETIIKEILCNQTTIESGKKISKKNIVLKKSKKESKSKKINKSSKVVRNMSNKLVDKLQIIPLNNVKDIGKDIGKDVGKDVDMKNDDVPIQKIDKYENKPVEKYKSKKISKKISKKPVPPFTPTQETINPSIAQQINNPVPVKINENETNIQNIKIPKGAQLPAFKIELPVKKQMVPIANK